MRDSFGNEGLFSEWDESTQNQFLNELRNKINSGNL